MMNEWFEGELVNGFVGSFDSVGKVQSFDMMMSVVDSQSELAIADCA